MWVDQRSCQGDISFQPVDYNISQNPSDVFGVRIQYAHSVNAYKHNYSVTIATYVHSLGRKKED